MFVVIKRHDVSDSSDGWAEWLDEWPVAHRTKADAERAMRALVPEGQDPVYAALRVERAPGDFETFGVVLDD